jgi:hypothetical protein
VAILIFFCFKKAPFFANFFLNFYFSKMWKIFPKMNWNFLAKSPNAFGFGWIGSDNISQALYGLENAS